MSICFSSVIASVSLMFYGVLLIICFPVVNVAGSLLMSWSLSSGLAIDAGFPLMLDSMSLLFSMTVTVIASMVLLFSTSYMGLEENLSRFVWLVVLFVISMNFLIFVPSLAGVVLGWDGLGLTSFVLVGYYQSNKALGASLVTAFMNRVGDALLLLSVALLSVNGHWYLWGFEWFDSMVGIVVLMVIVVSMTKSAQMPFSYWLPAAMSAPTPVSALVHSSTLVTAGVYLMVRLLSSMGDLVLGSIASSLLLIVSLVTVVVAGLGGCFEVDLKKVVALSTLSQLGVMMFSLSVGYYSLAFFHLISHALFKALLFLSVGRVLHVFSSSQELRDFGGLWVSSPCTSGCWALASMSLMGLPFLSGFYSKDLVIEGCLSGELNWVGLFGLVVGVASTSVYLGRIYMSSVWGKVAGSCVQSTESQSVYDVLPGMVLALGAVLGGYLVQSRVFSFSEVFVLESYFSLVVVYSVILGVVLSVVYSLKVGFSLMKKQKVMKFFRFFFYSMWFSAYLVPVLGYLGLSGSQFMSKEVDLGWNESVFGGLSLFNLILSWSKWLLQMWRKSLSTCLAGSFVVVFLMVQFIYP